MVPLEEAPGEAQRVISPTSPLYLPYISRRRLARRSVCGWSAWKREASPCLLGLGMGLG